MPKIEIWPLGLVPVSIKTKTPPLHYHQKHKISFLTKYNTQIQMQIEARKQANSKKKLNPIGKTILCQNATKILKMQLQYFRCILC